MFGNWKLGACLPTVRRVRRPLLPLGVRSGRDDRGGHARRREEGEGARRPGAGRQLAHQRRERRAGEAAAEGCGVRDRDDRARPLDAGEVGQGKPRGRRREGPPGGRGRGQSVHGLGRGRGLPVRRRVARAGRVRLPAAGRLPGRVEVAARRHRGVRGAQPEGEGARGVQAARAAQPLLHLERCEDPPADPGHPEHRAACSTSGTRWRRPRTWPRRRRSSPTTTRSTTSTGTTTTGAGTTT